MQDLCKSLLKWSLGIVMQLVPGKDGVVCIVEVKIASENLV